MSEARLVATVRSEFGKGASRRTRAAGNVPVVLYGHGEEPRHYSVNAREFARALKAGGANAVLTLEIEGGETELALPKAVVKHPTRDYFEHADLLIVKRGEKVTVDVPVVVTGSAAPATLVLVDATTLSVEAEALHIPAEIEVSVEGAEAGTQILAGQITLPSGTTLVSDAETLVVAVNTAEAAETGEESDEAADEAAEA